MLQFIWDMCVATGFGFVLLWSYAAVIWIPVAVLYAVFKACAWLGRKGEKHAAATVSLEAAKAHSFVPRALWLQWGLTSLPGMLFLSLSCMAWRAKLLLGHWPRVMADDPKWIGEGDFLYQKLYDWTDLSFALAGWSLLAWSICFIAMRQFYNREQRRSIVWAYAFAWILAVVGTGDGIAWYMD